MMTKEKILEEIRRTSKANGGKALGWRRFEEETGIDYYAWYGKYWTRWSDAVREAGLEPNRMSEAYDDDYLLERLVALTRKLGRVPIAGDLLIAARGDSFPSEKVFRRLGKKSERISRVIAYCQSKPGLEDVQKLWREVVAEGLPMDSDDEDEPTPGALGYVYLLRHGTRREYKIGRTNNPLRREGELGIQLPEKLQPIHYIKRDSSMTTGRSRCFAGS